jgi:hypothetical protein
MRSVTVDLYVCSWVLIEIICLWLCGKFSFWAGLSFVVTCVCFLRISEIFFTNLDIAIFSSDRLPVVASAVRTLTLTLINYIELWLCFSGAYAANLGLLRCTNPCSQLNIWDALYFSGTTQLTIGYGDIVPVALGRAVALAQGFFGYVFALLILSKLVGLVPSLRGLAPKDDK